MPAKHSMIIIRRKTAAAYQERHVPA